LTPSPYSSKILPCPQEPPSPRALFPPAKSHCLLLRPSFSAKIGNLVLGSRNLGDLLIVLEIPLSSSLSLVLHGKPVPFPRSRRVSSSPRCGKTFQTFLVEVASFYFPPLRASSELFSSSEQRACRARFFFLIEEKADPPSPISSSPRTPPSCG